MSDEPTPAAPETAGEPAARAVSLEFGEFAADVDLTPLTGQTHLRDLHVHGYVPEWGDTNPLATLTGLTSLHLAGRVDRSAKQLAAWRRRDFEHIAQLETLTRLHLGVVGPEDLRPLAALNNLTDVTLYCVFGVPDLSPLANLRLRSLAVNSVGVWAPDGFAKSAPAALVPLAGMPTLTSLRIGIESENNLAPLTEFPNLTDLAVSGEQASTRPPGSVLTPLSLTPGLASLDVEGIGFERDADYAPLSGLVNLTSLSLDAGSRVSEFSHTADLGELRGMTRLEELTLRRLHGVRNTETLADHQHLVTVTLDRLTTFGLDESRLGTFREHAGGFDSAPPHLSDTRYRARYALGGLIGLPGLQSLSVFSMPRLRSLRPIREMASLTELRLLELGAVVDTTPEVTAWRDAGWQQVETERRYPTPKRPAVWTR